MVTVFQAWEAEVVSPVEADSVEVEELVEIGAIEPDHVHLPGIYVQRIVVNATPEKRIEQRTIRQPEGN